MTTSGQPGAGDGLSDDERKAVCVCPAIRPYLGHNTQCVLLAEAVEHIVAARADRGAAVLAEVERLLVRRGYSINAQMIRLDNLHALLDEVRNALAVEQPSGETPGGTVVNDSERGLRFRIEVACMGYAALTDDDVPQEYIVTELHLRPVDPDPAQTPDHGES